MPGDSRSLSDTKRTVYIALAANALIALAKIVAGAFTGSAALLAEAAHSIADTVNQGLLRLSLTLGERAPDEQHPFGYGKERFFWTFMTSVFIFLAGAIFSIGEGVLRLISGAGESGGALPAYVVLAIALVAEGTSLVRALRQTRGEAGRAGYGLVGFIRVSRNPTSKMVAFEDSAAVAGVVVALIGIVLHQVTGQEAWDAGASIAIGCLLITVAVALGRDTKGLLIGEAALPGEQQAIRETIEGHAEVEEIVELLTMALGPEALLVAARIDLAAGVRAERIEEVSTEIEEEVRRRVPAATQVFLDAHPRRRGGRRAASAGRYATGSASSEAQR